MKDADVLMLAACELAGSYPRLEIEDIVGDVRQVARLVANCHLENSTTEGLVIHGACRLLAGEKELAPPEAVEKALGVWTALQKA